MAAETSGETCSGYSDQMIRALILIITKDKDKIRLINNTAVQSLAYFVARKLDLDLAYTNIYYTMWSKKVSETLLKLYKDGCLSRNTLKSREKSYVITEKGILELENFDERKRMLLLANLEFIGNTNKIASRAIIELAMIIDYTDQTSSDRDPYKTLTKIRLYGWFPTQRSFTNALLTLNRMKLPYKETSGEPIKKNRGGRKKI